MNLPNKLTLTRIILVPVFMIFVSLSQYMTPSYNPRWYLIAGIIFAVASFTDYLDGHLARKWHMVTDFGKFADPLADKLLTTVAFLYMMRAHAHPSSHTHHRSSLTYLCSHHLRGSVQNLYIPVREYCPHSGSEIFPHCRQEQLY